MAIVVKAEAFGPNDEFPDSSNETVVVADSNDPVAAAEALDAAAERLMHVTEAGDELTDEQYEANSYASRPLYTPNGGSEVVIGVRGPYMYVDCKSEIPALMRERFLAILTEELAAAGVHTATIDNTNEAEG